MAGMRIGDVARRTGLPVSTIRYYEKAGLLEPPARVSGQRRYYPDILGRIAVVALALRAGFTIAETRLFISGFSPSARPSERWRELAERKLVALDAEATRIAFMKALLEASFPCECPTLDVCERLIALSDQRRARGDRSCACGRQP